jgi:hypothetical protein
VQPRRAVDRYADHDAHCFQVGGPPGVDQRPVRLYLLANSERPVPAEESCSHLREARQADGQRLPRVPQYQPTAGQPILRDDLPSNRTQDLVADPSGARAVGHIAIGAVDVAELGRLQHEQAGHGCSSVAGLRLHVRFLWLSP